VAEAARAASAVARRNAIVCLVGLVCSELSICECTPARRHGWRTADGGLCHVEHGWRTAMTVCDTGHGWPACPTARQPCLVTHTVIALACGRQCARTRDDRAGVRLDELSASIHFTPDGLSNRA